MSAEGGEDSEGKTPKHRGLDEKHHTIDLVGDADRTPGSADGANDPTLAMSRTVVPPSGTPLPDAPLVDINHYVVGEEVARGGLGRILIAHDRRLGRPVAIKELIARDAGADARFLREARLTARLQHPSIVPVYEAGQWPDGKPFYAMKLVSGRSLKAVIAEKRSLRDRLALLPTVLAAADAIAYAHDQRIVHRDVKPANIIVGAYGETVVIDWGLAKDIDAPSEKQAGGPYRGSGGALTVEGEIVGTPAYMPPEQARGLAVDARADVYSLGAVLYQTLAGDAPYEGGSASEVVQRVLSSPPVPVEKRVEGVPRDLLAIVHKAMAREPADRYPDGAAFAADLSRFLSGQLVAAQRYSRTERARRWVARHRLPVTLSAVFLLALTTLAGVAVANIVHERNRAEAERDRARKERDRAEARGNEMTLASARASMDRDPTAALAWLKRYPESGEGWEESRGLALEAVGSGAAHMVLWPFGGRQRGALTPDGKRFIVQGDSRRIEVRDLESGQVVASSSPMPRAVAAFELSRDGKRLIGWMFGPTVMFTWSLDGAAPRVIAEGNDIYGSATVLTKDGRRLYIAEHGNVSVIGLDSGKKTLLYRHPDTSSIQLSPDESELYAVANTGEIVWGKVGEPPKKKLRGNPATIGTRLTPDGRYLVTYGNGLHVWDLQTGKSVDEKGLGPQIEDVELLPDGRIVSASYDRLVRVWDWRTGAVQVLEGHTAELNRVVVDPSGTLLASGGRDTTVRVWNLESGSSVALRGHQSQIAWLAFSADGKFVISESADQSTRVWRVPRDQVSAVRMSYGELTEIKTLDATHVIGGGSEDGVLSYADVVKPQAWAAAKVPEAANVVAVARDRDSVLETGSSGVVAYWQRKPDKAQLLELPGKALLAAAFSCDAKTIATGEDDDSVTLWDLAQPKATPRTFSTSGGGGAYEMAWSPDCQHFATQGKDLSIRLWNRDDGSSRSLRQGELLTRIAFSFDGQRLSTVSDTALRSWDLASGRMTTMPRAQAPFIDLAASPTADTLATTDERGEVRLWNPATGESRLLGTHGAVAWSAEFSLDGTRLATAGGDRMIRIWDVASGLQEIDFAAGATVSRAVFSLDGKSVYSGDNAGMMRAWRLEPRAPITRSHEELARWVKTTTTAVIGPDRRLITP